MLEQSDLIKCGFTKAEAKAMSAVKIEYIHGNSNCFLYDSEEYEAKSTGKVSYRIVERLWLQKWLVNHAGNNTVTTYFPRCNRCEMAAETPVLIDCKIYCLGCTCSNCDKPLDKDIVVYSDDMNWCHKCLEYD